MTTLRTRWPRAAAGAACLVAVALAAASCATIPTSGDVVEGAVQVDTPVDVGFNVQGPAAGSDPQQIVEGFVSAAQFGPASTSSFTTAQEYVTTPAWNDWDRDMRVLVLSEYPEWVAGDYDDSSTSTTVTGEALLVASLDESGVYTELPAPSTVDVTYDLRRDGDGEWRISDVADGLLVLGDVLGNVFHRTTLYYPTPDRRWWVPDVRWFPEQSWRTTASQEILAGPPQRLAQSAVSVVPEGTTLAIDAVTVDDDGVIDVSVTSAITAAPPDDRALLVAQLEATLREEQGRSVELSDGTNPLAVEPVDPPSRPLTVGDPLAIVDDGAGVALRRVVGTELTDLATPVRLGSVDPTAVGVGPDDGTVVLRDGSDRIVRATGDAAPSTLLEGEDLAAPSVDRFGTVWTAVDGVPWVVLASGEAFPIEAEWLTDGAVRSLRVSPEGARVAVVLQGAERPEVWVAAVERDADDVPTGLSAPVRVGAPVAGVQLADWSEETTLVLLGRSTDGTRSVYVAGVGGLPASSSGQTRLLVTPTAPVAVAAGVGASPMLLLDADGVLQVRQSAALWPSVSDGVVAAAYPG
ncbi:LpqB family beta-propeller domain-containing protein [Isoptericola aurantiacus]|uniref:LpqB family beta-propeller domain-containing protein n=1 Tax=Isoptericola aurantiacus TaxID=3377839 RepID=UPI00383B8E8D